MIVIILPKKITRNRIRLYNGKYDCISSDLYLEVVSVLKYIELFESLTLTHNIFS